ncbi:MFS transporter [Nonomuraea sp. K274]|uniref:MFS transporter n=1 Tax=Nonomuraea cypriaca TaxID=1187855 RepID=A0A931F4W9_9ACTN|nr:MFS transporter [Nonomuraea cypriaca]MBF8191423.1 MFS transporter [Nonomuraea cypriaca]
MTSETVEFDAGRMTRGQRRIALTAIGGYYVDGYDLLVLSGALLGIVPELSPDPGILGLVGASAFIGMALGSLLTGPLTDRFGRRPVFFASMAVFVLASLGFLLVNDVWQLIALRFFVGFAIGADMPASAALIAEFIPSRRRGTFTGLGGVAWMLGALTAIAATLLIFTAVGVEHWRWVLATGALAAVVLLFLRRRTPESPYWLRAHGRHEEALAAWRYATSGDSPPDAGTSVAGAGQPAPLRTLFRRPLAIMMVMLCVYWGFNNLYGSAILLYQPSLISRIVTPSTFTSLLFTASTTALAVILGLVVCMWVIESIGRRFIAIAGTAIAAVCTFLIWAGFGTSWLVLVAFAVTIAVINGGTSLAFYSWAPELFPAVVRGRAVGIVNMVGKTGSVVGTLALPSMFDALGAVAFLVISGLAVVNVVVTFLLAPETRGLTLRQLEERVYA